MNAGAPENGPTAPRHQPWSRLRWVVAVLLAFAAHLGLIFALGKHQRTVARAVVNPPTLRVVTAPSDFLLLNDPTLFALPHPHGFAGASWLRRPEVQFAPFRWSEPLRLLGLPVTQLGAAFAQFALTNRPPELVLQILAPPPLTAVAAAAPPTAVRQRSGVRLAGTLAQRRWLNAPATLRSWPAADVLTNSVVQVSVDEEGQNFRASLLPPGSGSPAADQYALDVARRARFAPTARLSGALTLGTMIFEWHAVPLLETNAAVAIP